MSKKKTKRYSRTIKRYSEKINTNKWLLLMEIAESYAAQKDYFLGQYNQTSNIKDATKFRDLRDEHVERKYKSPYGLQNRGYKLALKDALETMDRYWAGLASKWRKTIFRAGSLDEKEKHYLFKAIQSRRRLSQTLSFGDKLKTEMKLSDEQRKHCVRFLKKTIKKTVKKAPRVKIARSFLAEPETYRIFEHKKRQYIALSGKKAGNRLVVPLCGKKDINGQIRVVLDFEKQRLEIHHCILCKVKKVEHKKKKVGIDLGITEVFTDSDKEKWGKKFGKTTQKYSDEVKEKGKKRNKLYVCADKHGEKGNYRKAKKIKKHNLGKKKLQKKNRQRKEELARQVNEAINEFVATNKPKKIVYEELSHLRGKAKSKKMSRLVSSWTRGVIKDRLDFKSWEKDFELKAVNCAYSSCLCPRCFWVDKDNRKGDAFRCKVCGLKGDSDHFAAKEILRRDRCKEISLYMRKEQVYKVLKDRFWRKLQKQKPKVLEKYNWKPVYKVFGKQINLPSLI